MNKKIIISTAIAGVILVGGIFLITRPKTNTDTVVEYLPELPKTYNEAKTVSSSDSDVLTLVSATPTTIDKNGKTINYAAKNIETSKDGKTIKITLKDDLKYEDGSKVVAADYITAIKMLSNPKTKSSYSTFATNWIEGAEEYFNSQEKGNNQEKDIKGLKVINDNTYEIKLKKECSFYDSILSKEVFAPISQAHLDKMGGVEKYGTKASDVLSSGEYKIKKLEKEQSVELERNDNSILTKSELPKKIKFSKFADLSTAAKVYKNGDLNSIVKATVTDSVLNKKKDDKPDYESTTPAMSYLETSGLSKNVSRAMYLALDKKFINEEIYPNSGKLVNSLVPESYDKINSQLEYVNKNEFNLEEAKKLIGNEKPQIKFLTGTSVGPATKRFHKYLLDQWEKIGLKVEQISKPNNLLSNETFNNTNKDRSYQVTIASWGPDYNHESAFYNYVLGSNASTTYSKWDGPEFEKYDSLVKQAISKNTEEEAVKLYVQADKIRHDEGKMQPLWQSKEQFYVKKDGYKLRFVGRVLKPSLWEKK